MKTLVAVLLGTMGAALSVNGSDIPEKDRYFAITVVDSETGRGVPLVELKTVNGVSHVTDSAGIVAFDEPGLMGKDVFFYVSSHGYEYPKDGFGFRGKSLKVIPGGSAKLTIRRINIAQRLYRITGGGIYRDSLLVGAKPPLQEPALNSLVFGSDSVMNALYRGKIYWFWGDTNRPAYPLGNFHVPGATSELPEKGGMDPEAGVDLSYWVDDKGFAKPTAKMPGKGPTWLTTVIALPGQDEIRLMGSYIQIEPPMKVYARGLAVFNDATSQFDVLCKVDLQSPAFPAGHTFRHKDEGVDHVYFSHPFPTLRVRATVQDFSKIENYESFTCLKEGARDKQYNRDPKGRVRYAWQKNTPAVNQREENQLLADGVLQPAEARWQLRDRATGKPVQAHAGSVYWNDFRRRWIMLFVQTGGTSFLGEVWYAEAEHPTGPWTDAVKVVTHDKYSFYNPKQHPMFDKAGGRFIFFEGTYTHTFSGNPAQTPRYDYNQIMYMLDLADSRLTSPKR